MSGRQHRSSRNAAGVYPRISWEKVFLGNPGVENFSGFWGYPLVFSGLSMVFMSFTFSTPNFTRFNSKLKPFHASVLKDLFTTFLASRDVAREWWWH